MSKRAAGAVPHISSTGAYFVDSSVDKLAFEQRPLLSRKEAAVVLRVSPQTLAAWASNRRVVLPYAKIGRRVLYRRCDLDAFCAANVVGLNQAEMQHA